MKAMGLSRCQWKLLEELGDAYCANRIDGASCIYRDYGDHDVEICGGRTTHAPIHVFVWQKKPHMEIVERFLDLPHDCNSLWNCCVSLHRSTTSKKEDTNYA